MNPRISIPTDNIFKFYAMFGLVIMLTTAIMFFIRHEEYNRRAFEHYTPIMILKAEKVLDERKKLELYIYQQKNKIDKANRKFELTLYTFLFFLPGMFLTFYGFYMWHTRIQPKQDMLLNLQLEKLDAEIKSANKEVQRSRHARL